MTATGKSSSGVIRAEDMLAIRSADRQLKAAKRALRSVRAKRERRAARIDAAVKAYTEVARALHAAQADVQAAQHDYDQTILRAAQRVLRA